MKHLPIRLKKRRKELDYTQSDVAKKVKTTIANISGYENGNQNPSASMLLRLGIALNCSVDYLLGLTDTPKLIENQSNKTQLSIPELLDYTIFLEDGDPLTKEESKEMLRYILIQRILKQPI